jgi:hypothetical protein
MRASCPSFASCAAIACWPAPAAQSGARRSARAKALLEERAQGDRLACSFVCGAVFRRASGATDSCSQEAGLLCRIGDRAGRAAGLGQRLALMRSEPKQIWISSACPVVVDFIGKYHPECQPNIFGVLSPLLTHCKMLRAHYGDEIAIVFIGLASPRRLRPNSIPSLLDAVLTFEDLDHWLDEEEHSSGRDRRNAGGPLPARGGRGGRALSHRRRNGSGRCRQSARSTVRSSCPSRARECRAGFEGHCGVEARAQHLL